MKKRDSVRGFVMRVVLILVFATTSFFLVSCSKNKPVEPSSKRAGYSQKTGAEEFSSSLSYEISSRILSYHESPKNWDEAVSFYFQDMGMLQMGYGEPYDWKRLTERLKLQIHEHDDHLFLIFSKEDDAAFRKGIKYYEKQAEDKYSSARSSLALFYFQTHSRFKNVERGLFWSYRDAESGGSKGMLYLAYAYASGIGVVRDLEESIKWLYLSQTADAGFGWARSVLKEIEKNYPDVFTEIKQQSLEKAKVWMKEHPDAFFSPSAPNAD